VSYPHFPTARPRNPFRLLGPAQHILTAARRCGVDTTRRAEVFAWRKAGRPASWTNGEVER